MDTKMEKRMTAAAALALSVGFSAFLFLGTVQAEEGWSMTNEEWRYYDQDNQPVTLTWKQSEDNWYYLSADGTILKHCVFLHNDNHYYVDDEGKMAKNTWVLVDSGNSSGAEFEEGWHYFGADGKGYRRKNNSFKKIIGDSTYIFDENGVMLTGFIDEAGDWIDDETPFKEAKYYCGEDGGMYQNRWLEYDYQGEDDWDLRSDMAGKDYMEYESMWLYFDSTGKKVRSNNTDKAVQRTIAGETYGFDENGVMMSWWSKIATDSNATDSNATVKFYSGYDGGRLLPHTWVWMYPSEEMDADDYDMEEYSWWRTDGVGKVYRDTIRTVNSLKYAFDDIGRMQTGFLLFDGRRTFVAQYDIDTWESGDFIDGMLYGIENADLYLFGPDEFNGGAMQNGRDISVELADGVYTFGFRANGKAYGNRNVLAKNNDCYYINGLKLEAWDGLKYGVVKVSDDEYRVVNTSGKIVKGSKKLVWDGDNGWYIIIGDKFKAYVSDSDKPRWYNGDSGRGYYSYDKDSKTYGELFASKDSDADYSELPGDARLNFE